MKWKDEYYVVDVCRGFHPSSWHLHYFHFPKKNMTRNMRSTSQQSQLVFVTLSILGFFIFFPMSIVLWVLLLLTSRVNRCKWKPASSRHTPRVYKLGVIQNKDEGSWCFCANVAEKARPRLRISYFVTTAITPSPRHRLFVLRNSLWAMFLQEADRGHEYAFD